MTRSASGAWRSFSVKAPRHALRVPRTRFIEGDEETGSRGPCQSPMH